ncbi:hypothetical protein [Streptomyces viridosporus]|uniref:hypothetical protein n=1 Tax=Streptomyces viridosporus TaxID=67581 RepID=UPI003320AAB7
MLMIMAFVGLAALGPLWLFFFSGRRLAMSDDYAAISSAALLALLLLLLVELHLIMKEAAETVKAAREKRRELRQRGEEPSDLDSFDEALVSQTRLTVLGLVTSVLLSGALILVCLWAAVDAHGPARWLAWTSWLFICWGFTFVVFLALGKIFGENAKALFGRLEIDNDEAGAFLERYQRAQSGTESAPPVDVVAPESELR